MISKPMYGAGRGELTPWLGKGELQRQNRPSTFRNTSRHSGVPFSSWTTVGTGMRRRVRALILGVTRSSPSPASSTGFTRRARGDPASPVTHRKQTIKLIRRQALSRRRWGGMTELAIGNTRALVVFTCCRRGGGGSKEARFTTYGSAL